MAKRNGQQEFQGKEFKKPKDWFGGSYLIKSHAKTKRPLESKYPLHVVLRSDCGRTDASMRHPRHFAKVNSRVHGTAKKYGIRLYEYANVGNHLHLLIHFKKRQQWTAFIRELTGSLAREIQGLRAKEKKGCKFWSQKPFTRIVRSWRKAYRVVKDYVVLNQMEGEGLIARVEFHSGRNSSYRLFSPTLEIKPQT